MSEMLIERFVGIDVSKGSLDMFADPPTASLPRQSAYEDSALKTLCDGLAAVVPALVVVVVEASGGLGQRLASELAARGVPLAVVNPRQVRHFARASGEFWPRPTRSTRRCCAPSRAQSVRTPDRPRMPTRRTWPTSWRVSASW